MNNRRLMIGCLAVSACFVVSEARANAADARLQLTFTLDDVIYTDTATNEMRSAVFETSSEVGDLQFEDFGPNTNTFMGGGPSNPPGSVGFGSASEMQLVNGLDPFVDDIDMDAFGIGDSFMLTMDAFATVSTPGAVFFGQVASDAELFFTSFSDTSVAFTFEFSYEAELTGSLDTTFLPGSTSVFGEGLNVNGRAVDDASGNEYMFEVFDAVPDTPYFDFVEFHSADSVLPLGDSASGSFSVAFNPGDSDLSINFLSGLTVNARIDDVTELGDYNADGFVGAADLDILLANWGDAVTAGNLAQGDGSGDGLIGQADLQIVLDNWGDGTPPNVVPEPGTLAVFGLGGFALLRRRR
ncbi:PEP-CTERM sorting domain-containing protein [Phycisphaeraceae bacterium D3-23]